MLTMLWTRGESRLHRVTCTHNACHPLDDDDDDDDDDDGDGDDVELNVLGCRLTY